MTCKRIPTDHYDPALLDNPDFYPDGRDRGQNFTYASWLMSPCARGGGGWTA